MRRCTLWGDSVEALPDGVMPEPMRQGDKPTRIDHRLTTDSC